MPRGKVKETFSVPRLGLKTVWCCGVWPPAPLQARGGAGSQHSVLNACRSHYQMQGANMTELTEAE